MIIYKKLIVFEVIRFSMRGRMIVTENPDLDLLVASTSLMISKGKKPCVRLHLPSKIIPYLRKTEVTIFFDKETGLLLISNDRNVIRKKIREKVLERSYDTSRKYMAKRKRYV